MFFSFRDRRLCRTRVYITLPGPREDRRGRRTEIGASAKPQAAFASFIFPAPHHEISPLAPAFPLTASFSSDPAIPVNFRIRANR
jgi:hypothetical protein